MIVLGRVLTAMHRKRGGALHSATMTTDEVIGANVRGLCARRGIKTTTLAEHLGLTAATLRAKLRGSVAWMGQDIDAAAGFLKVDPGVLFDRRDLDEPRVTRGSHRAGRQVVRGRQLVLASWPVAA